MSEDEVQLRGGGEREPLLGLLDRALAAGDRNELSAAVEGWWALEGGAGAEALGRRLVEGEGGRGTETLKQHQTADAGRLSRLEGRLSAARSSGKVRADLEPRGLALLLVATLDGLLMSRLLEPDLEPELAASALRALLATTRLEGEAGVG